MVTWTYPEGRMPNGD